MDLLSIINSTKTIATAQVAANSSVNLIRFNITSASIVIGNKTYNVSTPNRMINIAITGGQKVNSSSASVLIDLFPTVNARAGEQGTAYMLVPDARAVIVNSNTSVSINTNIGGAGQISSSARAALGLNISES